MSNPGKAPAFSIIVAFCALMLIGAAFIPRLSVRLNPGRTSPGLSVSYSWPGASPRIIEQEVTAPLEGLFSTIRGITKVESTSAIGSGSIYLSFDKKADMDAMRFEVASKIREVYPKLPEKVGYPRISAYRNESEEQQLLTYQLYAPASPRLIQSYAEERLRPLLAPVQGLYRITIYGATPMEWELIYDQEELLTLGIKRQDIMEALNIYFREEVIGMGWDQAAGLSTMTSKSIQLKTLSVNDLSWQDIPVTQVNDRIFRIRNLCRIVHKEQEPTGYYRINGDNTVSMVLTAEKGANSLKVAQEIKDLLLMADQELPTGYKLMLRNDSTQYIKEQLRKIIIRTIFSFTILLLFVFLVSRKVRYLLIIFISLIANLLTACILYYVVGIEINLYSLAGITVSLGLIIDNTIVMVDHLRTKGNRKVFLAILAATLTTVGALSIIRFLGESTQLQLRDFSLVLIVNLFVSLMVALFLVPSLVEKIGLGKRRKKGMIRGKRHVVRFSHHYANLIGFSQRFRWAFIVVAILIFGLPISKLPTRMEGEKWYHKVYRTTLASETYVQKIKPVTDKVFGGTLRLFLQNVYNRYSYRMPERTTIFVRASLPQGATLQQMNDLMIDMERYLTGREQIDQFLTTINGPRSATLTVTFKKDYELGAFPFVLYSQLQSFSNQQTGADWWVQGIGQGFSNSLSDRVGSQQITLYGFNFEQLWIYAEEVMALALSHQRVEKVSIMSERIYIKDPLTEYVIRMDPERLQLNRVQAGEIYSYLEGYALHRNSEGNLFVDGAFEPVRMQSVQSDRFDTWMLGQTPIKRENMILRLGDMGKLAKEEVNKSIVKEDQQYRLIVEYEFVGVAKVAQMHRDRIIVETKDKLPIGYSIKESEYRYWQREKNRQLFMILMVIGIIYVICSILLESLMQPLAVVLMIPISFVGVFLTFYLFKFSFDQGGFASFILLSGIVVNASLYILNDFNNFKRKALPTSNLVLLYVKAYNGKIIPICLTVLSTVFGLIPFLAGGDDEVFWFSLATGTIGGLIFSIFAVILFMPAFLRFKPKHDVRPTKLPTHEN